MISVALLLALSAALIALVRTGRWSRRPEAPTPPPDTATGDDEDLELDVAVASTAKRGVPIEVTRARRAHRAELLSRAERSVAPLRLHIVKNTERGMWQIWAGAKRFEDANIRAEKSTELGAIRCLLNAHGAPRGNFWVVEPEPRARRRRSKPRLSVVRAAS